MLKEYLTSIANVIRSILGGTDKINAQDFKDKIQEVYESGFGNGDNAGYGRGFDEGKQAEYDAFWDKFQNYGNRIDYAFAFAEGQNYAFWSNGFTPKYPIAPVSSTDYMFYCFGYKKGVGIDFNAFCQENNINITLSSDYGNVVGKYTFAYSSFSSLPKMTLGSLQYTFLSCSKLESIEEIATCFTNNTITTVNGSAFGSCSALKEVRFSCVLDCNGLNFSSSTELSYDSLKNIKEQLKDRSGSTSKTITFGNTNLAKFTADDLAEIEAKGWTVK